jgi:hypothetical protein
MDSYSPRLGAVSLLLLSVVLATPGCELAGGIFKAGFWVGIVIAVVVIGGIMAFAAKARG